MMGESKMFYLRRNCRRFGDKHQDSYGTAAELNRYYPRPFAVAAKAEKDPDPEFFSDVQGHSRSCSETRLPASSSSSPEAASADYPWLSAFRMCLNCGSS